MGAICATARLGWLIRQGKESERKAEIFIKMYLDPSKKPPSVSKQETTNTNTATICTAQLHSVELFGYNGKMHNTEVHVFGVALQRGYNVTWQLCMREEFFFERHFDL